MIIARIAYDAPGKDEQRKALFEAHRAHLRSGMARIVQSGPLFGTDAPGAKRGALVVFEAADLAEVERFNAADHEEHPSRDHVHNPDPLVIGCRQPREPAALWRLH
jgi:uncharacterized protein YciI